MKSSSRLFQSILIWCIVLFCFLLSLSSQEQIVYQDDDDDDHKDNKADTPRMFNFASHSSGAVILDQSPSSGKGYHNLLNDDKDKYAISQCQEKKWVVVGLSEDILITAVALVNYEKYSSTVKDFQILAASFYPTSEWIDLGTYTAEPKLGEQVFNITQVSSSHTRYLKLKFLTHYGDEALCTLSQIKVYGLTVIASLQQDVDLFQHQNVKVMLKENEENSSKSDEDVIPSPTVVPIDVSIDGTGGVEQSENQAVDSTTGNTLNDSKVASEEVVNAADGDNSSTVDNTATELETSNESMVDNEGKTSKQESNEDDSAVVNNGKDAVEEEVNHIESAASVSSNESESDHEDHTQYESLTSMITNSQFNTQDELESQKVTIAGLELNIADWKKVHTIFEESHASMNIVSRTMRRIKEFFDPIASKMELNRLEGHLSSSQLEKRQDIADLSVSDADSKTEGVSSHNESFEDKQSSEPVEVAAVNSAKTDDANIDSDVEVDGDSVPASDNLNTASTVDNEQSERISVTPDNGEALMKDDSHPSSSPTPDQVTEEGDERLSQQKAIKDLVGTTEGIHLNCYESLEFDDFREKILQKSPSLMKDEIGNPPMSLHSDNVFKQLIKRNRALEVNEAILELYIEEMTECFKVVSKEASMQWQRNKELLNRLESFEDVMSKKIQALESAYQQQNSAKDDSTTAKDSSKAHDLHLLQFVKQPDFQDTDVTLDDIFHRIIYYFLHWMKDVKMTVVPTIKETNWFNKFFHRSKHFKENKQHFLATHSSWEIYREYVIEIFLVIVTLGAGLAVMSSLLLGCFLAFMWLLYHFKSNKMKTDNNLENRPRM